MKKLLLALGCLMLSASAWATNVSLAFTTIGSTNESGTAWTNSYNNTTTYSTSEVSVKIEKFSKQTGTVTDVPVVKDGTVTITALEGATFSSFTFNFKQWTTKTQTATMQYSTDGTNFTNFDPAISVSVGSTTAVSAPSTMPAGVIAIQIKTTDTKNQIGLASFDYEFNSNGPKLEAAGLAFSQESCEVKLGEAFTEPTLTKATDAEVTYESSNVAVATVDAATGKVTLVADGTTTITATTPATDAYTAGIASYTIKVTDPNKVVLEDELTTDALGMSGTSYVNYTDKTISTDVVYAVKGSVSNGIQINTNNTGKNSVNSCVINTSVPANLVIDKILVNASGNKFTISVSNSAWSFSGETTSTTITAPETSVDLDTPAAKNGDYYELVPQGNYQYFIIKSTGAVQMPSIKVIYRVVETEVKAEEAEYIFEEDGIEADEQGNVNLNGGKATLHILVPTGHSLYYKHTIHAAESAPQMRRVVDHGDFKKADVDEQGYAKIDVDKNSTLEYYTFHEEAQVKSPVTTLSFSGAGTSSISEINATQTRNVIYDLQGRRISAPVRGINIIDGRKVRL